MQVNLKQQRQHQDLFLLALAFVFFGAVAGCPARGQEPPKPAPAAQSTLFASGWSSIVKPAPATAEKPPAAPTSPLVASGWCIVKSSSTKKDPAASATKDTAGPGCDVGVGAALVSRGRFSLVAAIGTKTIGTGIAWTAYKPTPQFPRAIAVAIGIASSWDSTGIGHKIYPVIGATVSFFGASKEGRQP